MSVCLRREKARVSECGSVGRVVAVTFGATATAVEK